MKPEIREDIRTFAQFYPDPRIRHRVHASFAHRFLPKYVHRNPFAFFSYLFNSPRQEPTRFIQSRWNMVFEEGFGLVAMESPGSPIIFRRVSDLSMSLYSLDGRPVALIQMPKPEQAPEAFLIGVVLLADIKEPGTWARDVQARVFTLELTLDSKSKGLVCEWEKDKMHNNYGFVIFSEGGPVLQAQSFLQTIGRIIQRAKRSE